MSRHELFFSSAQSYLQRVRPENPILFFSAHRLRKQHALFTTQFPGLVTFAVKAQPSVEVIETLVAGGMNAFDVASPAEMKLVRGVHKGAVLHYNNPIRSKAEIEAAIQHRVASYSIDRMGELEKLLAALNAPTEISVRLKLSTNGGKIDFGSKFGADETHAIALLKRVAESGHKIAMCFHPGTQCLNASAWCDYIKACARCADAAGVTLERLNVGGGFPSRRNDKSIDLTHFFDAIRSETIANFGPNPPELLCEPGRAMVAEAFSLATKVKAVCDNQIFLNDGIYGGLSEMRDIGTSTRIEIISANSKQQKRPFIIFGPTCDSLDVLPDPIDLPENMAEGDYIIFDAMGAYSSAIATEFNGYGKIQRINLSS